MNFTDEKDYIMRMIKEMVRVLFSLAFGKKYVSVELEKENKYEVSGKNLKNFLNMIDLGQINEAENILLDSIDYTNKNEVMAVALFYQYLSEKDNQFLENNNYTKEEKEKYDEKKLCRTMGLGMSIIAILLLTMGLLENILPAFFVYIASGIILVDVVVIIILGNTICRK